MINVKIIYTFLNCSKIKNSRPCRTIVRPIQYQSTIKRKRLCFMTMLDDITIIECSNYCKHM